jgi:ribosomal-protein-alanine N-acetyltransferase
LSSEVAKAPHTRSPVASANLPVPAIETARLQLVSMTVRCMRALVTRDIELAQRDLGAVVPNHFPDTLDDLLHFRLGQLDEDPSLQRWLARAIVLTDADGVRRAIGAIGFHGAPDEYGRLEIGYRIDPGHRRHGYAREAVEAMLRWAAEQGIVRFVASIRPDNEASLALAAGLGFVQTGTQVDEVDGLELVLETTWPAPGE